MAEDQAKLNKTLFGDRDSKDCFQSENYDVVMINHYDRLSQSQIYHINHLLEEKIPGKLVILSTTPNNKNRVNTSIQIELPNFNLRPLSEKIQVIEAEFDRQAQNAGKPIIISSDLLLSLAQHEYSHGFKEVMKYITLACAKSYLRSIDNIGAKINIVNADLPDTVINRTADFEDYQDIKAILAGRNNFIFYGKKENYQSNQELNYNQKLYRHINSNYQDLLIQGLNPENIQQSVYKRVQKIYDEYNFHGVANSQHDNELDLSELRKIVPQKIIELVKNYLAQVQQTLRHQIDSNLFYGLCLHINSMINLGTSGDYEWDSARINNLKEKYPEEYKLTEMFSDDLYRLFDYSCSESEKAVLLTFLVEPKGKQIHPVVLYAMHGKGTAHFLSQTTNDLNHTKNSYAYDMQLNKDINVVYKELNSLVKKINQGAGIIVIYDMGSFKDIFMKISKQTNISIRLINIPVTLIGLEVSRKALMSTNIDNVYHDTLLNMENYNVKNNENKQGMIITLCHTGEGGAIQLKDYIEQYSQLGWVVKAMSVSERGDLARSVLKLKEVYNIKAFVGTFNPELFGIPFISIAKVFENRHEDLDKVLNFIPINVNSDIYQKIYNYYESELKFTRVDKLKELMPMVMDSLVNQYQLDSDQQVGIFTHIVGTLENILSGKKRPKVEMNPIIYQKSEADFEYLTKCLYPLEKEYKVVFNEGDLYTIILILKKL
ncbi:transcriptional regulatory protein LevR [Lactobacillus colini]|uniref:Transcriptional regulatory protein LevR n=1 Tax=Lactobacillus colini TaxID=1819254 RepID=A0ABS4MGV2_9LACO|nr:PRD domain-containing protein [Lactobacillus colini]MBP2058923.1 transcriptional regulatory protein LevR [Lactobacillus colini]